ncbi:hypothetical protein RJP21_03185 [Paenibacillus sp. VCA1]|uniref:hypothetical protein n=1 Tax=Paenibacillus sp. VCA1 TaxID=3039148 RepID=UPI002871C436|nr:hypothetical protein [Paenibacillus sp. VCA1]MDR9852605.1 hypothetical protein [Paenibacillus sp. VCA1]
MGKKILKNLGMTIESRSYVDAMHAVLTHAGWTTYSKAVLSGVTVTGFRFAVHRRLTAESPTAYNWMAENFLAADFVGVTASSSAGFSFHPTFPLYRDAAIGQIKASLDRGVGAVFWKDGFAIAAGYDDEDGILYYDDGGGLGLQRLPYDEFGQNESPYWYYQVFEGTVELDPLEIYKESLMQAAYKWETPDRVLPEADYACGFAAYDAIKQALSDGAYDPVQAAGVFESYAAAKRDVSEYMEMLSRLWPQLEPAADGYRSVADAFQKVMGAMDGDHNKMKRKEQSLVLLFDEAQQAEHGAIGQIKTFMQERIRNRFDHIGLR